jgi:hypothetical protein
MSVYSVNKTKMERRCYYSISFMPVITIRCSDMKPISLSSMYSNDDIDYYWNGEELFNFEICVEFQEENGDEASGWYDRRIDSMYITEPQMFYGIHGYENFLQNKFWAYLNDKFDHKIMIEFDRISIHSRETDEGVGVVYQAPHTIDVRLDKSEFIKLKMLRLGYEKIKDYI